jgi:hypothetical protein
MFKWPQFFCRKSVSDGSGMDQAYEQAAKTAEKELDATLAGPDNMRAPADDTDMKNPDGEFSDPAPMVESPAGRAMPGWDSRGDRFKDPEGQQGGTVGTQPTPNQTPPADDAK